MTARNQSAANRKPLAYDLFCGLGGWTDGLLVEGYRVIGFDIERHDYGDGKRYPAELVIQDVLTLDGATLKDAALIVASPPCQDFSYMAMPWSRAKAIAAEYRSGKRDVKKLTALFDACFRIQREAIAAAGHFIPLVVENVRGAQPWVGRARWNFGSFYLWGDVPALMPITMPRRKTKVGSWNPTRANFNPDKTWDGSKNTGGSWFNIGSPGQKETNRNPMHELSGNKMGPSPGKVWKDRPPNTAAHREKSEGFKSTGLNWSDRSIKGQDFTRVAGQQNEAVKVHSESGRRTDVGKGARFTSRDCGVENGVKHGGDCFNDPSWTGKQGGTKQPGISGRRDNGKGDKWFQDGAARSGSKSNARKAASATIAKIPLPLARWIAKTYYPRNNPTP